ncbi:histone H1 [candidate division KSB1 bacterium]|nr:histone H1 [candidate division KSB1 bacterium]
MAERTSKAVMDEIVALTEQMAKENAPGSKAGKARARKISLQLTKLQLEYRKVSIDN